MENAQPPLVLKLNRIYHLCGTNGNLSVDNKFLCHSIELPWLNNKAKCSCIPEGNYQLLGRTSNKFGQHFILQNVPGRKLILIHPANIAALELKGCIAPVTKLVGPGQGLQSLKAFNILSQHIMAAINAHRPVWLNIFSMRTNT